MNFLISKLDSIATFINGDRGKNYPSKGSFVEHGVPFISAGNLSNSKLDVNSFNYITEEQFELLSNGKVKKNDILFCLRGSLGKFSVVKNIDKGAIASSLIIIRINENIDLNYLKHYLGSPLCSKEINNFKNGAAQPNLSAKDLKNFDIPLPPLPEQKKIVEILDAADLLRQKDQQLIEHYKQLSQSIFLDMFGDPVVNSKKLPIKPLGELCDFFSGKAWKKAELGENGFRLVRISNLHKPNFPYWYYEGKMIEKHKVEKGDLLFSWAGVKTSIDTYIYDDETAMLNQHIYNIKPKGNIDKKFLFNILQLHLVNLRNSLGGGVGQFHLKKKDVTSIEILMPENILMNDYLQMLENINIQKSQAMTNMQKSEKLFNCLLQKAFTGELTQSL